mmetsp:Transcript_46428/g.99008  ORF Transcript_46428/g.99008 Transcript_46428/m.99008 type:complete len:95 (-) Transcript_46428:100-384(-)
MFGLYCNLESRPRRNIRCNTHWNARCNTCNIRRPFPDAGSNTQPFGLGFDESQLSPAKKEDSSDEEDDQPLGERMRKRAKLLEDEAKQLEDEAK